MEGSLSSYRARWVKNERALQESLTTPLLVWEVPAGHAERRLLLGTLPLADLGALSMVNEPTVFELKKRGLRPNAFALGITLGRSENNDVVLEDQSVSRFHAYFQQDEANGSWKLVDAESRNGTWVGMNKLAPNAGESLPPSAPVRFGDLRLVFYSPERFLAFLREHR